MGRQTSELLKLSGSTNGKQIKVTGTNSAGAIVVHTAHATALDLVWLTAHNVSGSDVTLSIEWGETTDPIALILPAGQRMEILAGDLLTGGHVIEAFANVANVVFLMGQVERVTNNG